MKKKIIKIPFANLKKNYFHGLVKTMLEIVKKHDPASLFIQVMFSKLEAYESSLGLFVNKVEKKHPMTDIINERYTRAKELIYALKFQMKSFQKRNFPDEEETLNTISNLLENSLGKTIYTAKHSIKHILDQIQVLMDNDDFVTAVETMGIKKHLVEMVELNKDIETLESRKVESRVRKKMTDLPKMKGEIVECYTNLMQAIELAQVEHPEIDYKPLIIEINEFLQPYVIEIRRMKTRNQNNQIAKTKATALSDKTSAAAI